MAEWMQRGRNECEWEGNAARERLRRKLTTNLDQKNSPPDPDETSLPALAQRTESREPEREAGGTLASERESPRGEQVSREILFLRDDRARRESGRRKENGKKRDVN